MYDGKHLVDVKKNCILQEAMDFANTSGKIVELSNVYERFERINKQKRFNVLKYFYVYYNLSLVLSVFHEAMK